MSITLNEAFKEGIISEEVFKSMPKKCFCGTELCISESLRNIECSNKICKMKTVHRVDNMCKSMGIRVRLEDILEICNNANIESPYQFLMLNKMLKDNKVDASIPNLSSIILDIENALKIPRHIYEIIEFCGIDDISIVAKAIAKGFNSIDELFREIETGQLNFICERLSLGNTDISVLGVRIYNSILALKEELIFAEYIFKVKRYEDRLKVVVSGAPIEYVNTSELLRDIEVKTGYTVCQMVTVSVDTDILIKCTSSDGVKEKMARLINDKMAAEQVNSGTIDIDNIGKEDNNNLAAIGYTVYIDSPKNVINKLLKLRGCK